MNICIYVPTVKLIACALAGFAIEEPPQVLIATESKVSCDLVIVPGRRLLFDVFPPGEVEPAPSDRFPRHPSIAAGAWHSGFREFDEMTRKHWVAWNKYIHVYLNQLNATSLNMTPSLTRGQRQVLVDFQLNVYVAKSWPDVLTHRQCWCVTHVG